MKIAVVTDDGYSISAHFGRATKYAVYTLKDGQVIDIELRHKLGHQDFHGQNDDHHQHDDHQQGHGFGRNSTHKHNLMFQSIPDCQVVLARGMGRGAYEGIQIRGMRPILTEIKNIEDAVIAVVDGSIINHEDRLH